MGRGLLLWLIGIPIPIILLIWLFGGLHGWSTRQRFQRAGSPRTAGFTFCLDGERVLMGLSLTPPASPSRCKVDRYRCCGEAPARALVVGRTYRYQLRQSTRRNLLPEARGYAHRKEEELRSTGNAWERHGLFRYGALVAARIAARRSNVRKKAPPNIWTGNIQSDHWFRLK